MSEGIKAGLKRSEKNKARLERGDNGGGRCKIFFIDGFLIQGRYELYFFLRFRESIIANPNRIETPFGFYTPDFEFKNNFIEIKSSYTVSTELFVIQQKKIKWVSDNIKKSENHSFKW